MNFVGVRVHSLAIADSKNSFRACSLFLLLIRREIRTEKPHIDSQSQCSNMSPEWRSFDGSSNNLPSSAFNNNWQSLTEVSTKAHYDTSERPIILTNVSKCTIDCFKNMAMLHYSLIPKD